MGLRGAGGCGCGGGGGDGRRTIDGSRGSGRGEMSPGRRPLQLLQYAFPDWVNSSPRLPLKPCALACRFSALRFSVPPMPRAASLSLGVAAPPKKKVWGEHWTTTFRHGIGTLPVDAVLRACTHNEDRLRVCQLTRNSLRQRQHRLQPRWLQASLPRGQSRNHLRPCKRPIHHSTIYAPHAHSTGSPASVGVSASDMRRDRPSYSFPHSASSCALTLHLSRPVDSSRVFPLRKVLCCCSWAED